MLKRLILAIALVASLPLHAKQTITLGVVDSGFEPIAEHLSSSPGIAVEMRSFPNHDALYAALKDGKVDLAFLGAVKYVQAHFEFGAVPLVAEGKATRTALAVPVKSPVSGVKQLKGKKLAFGYEGSTSTHLIPLLVLSRNGLQPEDVKPSFVGSHPQDLVDQMLAGKFEACAISESLFSANKGRLRVLEWSDPFPAPPLVARKGITAGVAAEIRRLMATYKPRPGGARFQQPTPVTDTDYNRIRFLCKVVLKKSYL